MSNFERKYGVATVGATHIYIPLVKAGSNDFALGADWSPQAGDVKVTKNDGTPANINTLPAYVANQGWKFIFTAAELQCKQLTILIVDSVTKAVEDQFFVIETYGNASAMKVFDYDVVMRGTENGATAAALATHDGKLDTVDNNVDSILEDTGTDLPAQITSEHGTINTNIDSNETKIDSVISNQADQALDATVAKDSTVAKESQATINKDEIITQGGAGPWTSNAGGDATEAKQDTIIANQAALSGEHTAINTNVDDNEAKIDAVKVDTAATKAKTDQLNFSGTEVDANIKAKDATVGLSTQEKADVLTEARKPTQDDTMSEIVDMNDVPAEPTIAQAQMLHYMERRNGQYTDDKEHKIHNDAGDVILEQDISEDDVEGIGSQLRNPTV